MTEAFSIEQIFGICFTAQFFIYGLMAFSLYPYDDYEVAERMRNTESKQYLHARRAFGMIYIFLAIAAFFGLHPAPALTIGGWQLFLIPACLTMFYVAHTWMLLGLCNWKPFNRKIHLLRLLPLPMLCVVYAIIPSWGEAVAVLQSVHLVLLIAWYTPLFYKRFIYLNSCCWDAVNKAPDEVASDYDCLPESMPWIGRRYQGLLVIVILALLIHFLPYGWGRYGVAVLVISYLFWFFYWVFQRFPRFARSLFYYMNEEEG